MSFVLDEPYEALVAAISHIDAAVQALNTGDIAAHQTMKLDKLRNELNAQRCAMLGGGQTAPYFVSDLMEIINDWEWEA